MDIEKYQRNSIERLDVMFEKINIGDFDETKKEKLKYNVKSLVNEIFEAVRATDNYHKNTIRMTGNVINKKSFSSFLYGQSDSENLEAKIQESISDDNSQRESSNKKDYDVIRGIKKYKIIYKDNDGKIDFHFRKFIGLTPDDVAHKVLNELDRNTIDKQIIGNIIQFGLFEWNPVRGNINWYAGFRSKVNNFGELVDDTDKKIIYMYENMITEIPSNECSDLKDFYEKYMTEVIHVLEAAQELDG